MNREELLKLLSQVHSGELAPETAADQLRHLPYEDPPAEELERIQFIASSFHTGKRLSKVGRPTKKERRDLDDFMED